MNKIKIMFVFGTRPEVIKMVPLIKEIKKRDSLKSIIVITGQHREILKQELELFEIIPDYDFEIMQECQTLSFIVERVLFEMERVINDTKPDVILVQGDTSSAFAASLAAFHNKVKIGHIEAGLRSFDNLNPFPEEINRKLISVISDLNFVPNQKQKENLLKENVSEEKIFITGNTIVDAVKMRVSKKYVFKNEILRKIFENNYTKKILVTTHRRENLDGPLINICKALLEIVKKIPNAEIIFPVHPNPAVKKTVFQILKNVKNINLLDPIDATDAENAIDRSFLVLTDSGGIQEESAILNIPVLILRENTERQEIIEHGKGILIGTETNKILNETIKLFNDEKKYKEMKNNKDIFGDGKASKRIINILLKNLTN